MNILFTGASSFTGYWFVQELVANGHEVTATFTGTKQSYADLSFQHLTQLPIKCHRSFQTQFGHQQFLDVIIKGNNWDLLCHHGAMVSDYKSPSFDAVAALANNTNNLQEVIQALQSKGCKRILLTGSMFEANEGGSRATLPILPYGLSKTLTTMMFRHYCAQAKIRLGHFVIPTPFGPWEKEGFTTYLLNSWLVRKRALIKTPDYVRDNIHVDLLAKAYVRFAQSLPARPGLSVLRPSSYVETQGAFARRVAQETQQRTSLPCELQLLKQTDFSQPMKRINKDKLNHKELGFTEKTAWDLYINHYQNQAKK